MTPELTMILTNGFTLIFYILLLCYVLFSASTFYHWFTFGNSKSISTLSLVTYLVVSTPLLLTMAISLSLM
jgi:hypothetical protein